VTGILHGYEGPDIRTPQQINSAGIRDKFGAKFYRCTEKSAEGPKCDLGAEKCYVKFTPTIPGIYQVDFFNLIKYEKIDTKVRAVPFPVGQAQRTIIVVPGPTSAGHSHVHGPGLNYAFGSRAGLGNYFWIDSYDEHRNPRLSGGDQWTVTMVAADKGNVVYGRVTNLGNGTYYVGYNITISGRYTVSVTLQDTPSEIACFGGATTVPLIGGVTLKGGELQCHSGTLLADMINATKGVTWCPPGLTTCTSWTFQNPSGLSPLPPHSPFSVWIDSGPTGTDTVQAFGWGMSEAIAGYPAFFHLRIRYTLPNPFFQHTQEKPNITKANLGSSHAQIMAKYLCLCVEFLSRRDFRSCLHLMQMI
jgi:hypothetical protein